MCCGKECVDVEKIVVKKEVVCLSVALPQAVGISFEYLTCSLFSSIWYVYNVGAPEVVAVVQPTRERKLFARVCLWLACASLAGWLGRWSFALGSGWPLRILVLAGSLKPLRGCTALRGGSAVLLRRRPLALFVRHPHPPRPAACLFLHVFLMNTRQDVLRLSHAGFVRSLLVNRLRTEVDTSATPVVPGRYGL